MAIKINTTLTIGNGIIIPSGSVIVPTVHTVKPLPYMDGEVKKYKRLITYDNFLWQSVEDYRNDLNGNKNMWVNEIPSGWEKEMTDQEMTNLLSNGLLAEVWLMNHINSLLEGNHCEIINAAS